jgi:hypothetical protein
MKAFPLKSVNMFDDNEGMDLRDWFAGLAMQGMFASDSPDYEMASMGARAAIAYDMADIMMKERKK